jgi:5'-nucleotidase
MPVILITNDDGGSAQGIRALSKALQSVGEVYVIAPEREQSAVGHALTLHRPLKFEKINNKKYLINGTPTDCVILGVNRLLPQKPDLVVSGINNGGNMGDDITYSGTVAAAIEGTLLGILSIAISFVGKTQSRKKSLRLQRVAQFAQRLASQVLKKGLPPDTFLNVNVPDSPKIKGIRLTRQGKRVYDNPIQEMLDPRGRKHYWIGSGVPMWESGEDTDFEAVQNGFTSITPIHLDLTNYKALEYMKKHWGFTDNRRRKKYR